jgi:hypothetical protein
MRRANPSKPSRVLGSFLTPAYRVPMRPSQKAGYAIKLLTRRTTLLGFIEAVTNAGI